MRFELTIDDSFFISSTQIGKIELKDLISKLKPIQKRRLSNFSKLAIGALLNLDEQLLEGEDWELVFASRHGDFHKTSELLTSLALKESLSPSGFSLSVHNAVAGMYSIFMQKKVPITSIAAGKDGLFAALTDAYIRLSSKQASKVVVVLVDQSLPEQFLQFSDEQQSDYALAMVLSKAEDAHTSHPHTLSFTRAEFNAASNSDSPAIPIEFAKWLDTSKTQLHLSGQKQSWTVERLN
ncbi:beta-ketoacyl synthase chain length factor [Pseudoalteromonas luteoviolacea]|uniref:Beta-ketoacyl synthase-like N-terminal domain-containing protein n=1 Tax=Pseudoalteromonas luteoviolacea S4054 TaxID=1129367 RepID=A0A0F6ACU1_9GAMM|nr:beta-ketoacyl synthase chain length factor [Pseudoalteromonas luteoviolacea]AOT06486.1 hypothetical protein S4054249_00650 [Pseudoalteromonas luteoviolacea]AOT11403.1 hypothetical protein S40542_00650 [Pseudoalteromonas luteoviolacea]AOT16316.1 hypothetical protein S4054_00650 [Pseudoalteromonas luteoviolacea]KKE83224.1 hypothetical protein N479_15085 [Pseudoalteromonas luteoviolacea S4054]KZN71155.1 hypothetical protein N481_19265 [Pseudoalteromonas luteoviolacea S4047-1]